MNTITVGINHKTAPIEIREKFFLNATEQELLLSELKCHAAILEAFVLSTCNRTEITASVIENEQNYFAFLVRMLASLKRLPYDSRKSPSMFYTYTDQEAVYHLLKVVTGLDSMVLGEKQILGQVKLAFARARECGMLSRNFNILANLAIRTGKKAQLETDIGYGGSSISWSAVMMAEKSLGTLQGKSVLIIGAGKMGELAVDQISNKGASKIFLMNRTQSIAEELSRRFGATAVSFCDIKEVLSEVDVCFCSASAPHYVLEKGVVEKVMPLRCQRKLCFIDISVPRNIDPAVAEVPHVTLAHVDNLESVLGETMRIRQAAVNDVARIIEDKLAEFYHKLEKAQGKPVIVDVSS